MCGWYAARSYQLRSQRGAQDFQVQGKPFTINIQASQQRGHPRGIFGKQRGLRECQRFAEVIEVVTIIFGAFLASPFPPLFEVGEAFKKQARHASGDRVQAFFEYAARQAGVQLARKSLISLEPRPKRYSHEAKG